MNPTVKSSVRNDWRRLIELGHELMAQPGLSSQQDLILEATTDLVEAEATLWLNAAALGVSEPERVGIPSAPLSAAMHRALEQDGAFIEPTVIALPLRTPALSLGVLEARRTQGPPFTEDEQALLLGLAAQAGTALEAGRKVAVERWRVDQLSLVRSVSAEVATLLDLDELALRVTRLVLRTFRYYYAALFTLEPDQENLVCRGSAGPSLFVQEGGDSQAPRPSVRLGQGIVGQVAETGEEIIAGNVSHEPHYRHVDVLPETKSEAALPLKIKERVLGVLDVQSDQSERFDETDLLVLRALADQIAIAVEGARLYTDLRRRADQLSAVAEVGRAVASVLDLDELLRRVAALIHQQFGYPYVHLHTLDPVEQKVLYRTGWPPRDPAEFDVVEPVCDLSDTEGVVAWVACHGETLLSNDVQSDPRYRPLAAPVADARAQLAVPLVFGGDVLGVLDVQSDQPNAFTQEDRFVFEALADSIAIAIRNANLYQSERWRRQVADRMRDVALLLSAGIELDEVLDEILSALEKLVPCDASAIWLMQEDVLCLSAVHGTTEWMCVDPSLLDADAWLRQALYAEGPVVRESAGLVEPLGEALGFEPEYSAIAAPLRAGDRPLGLLMLAHRMPDQYGRESRAMTATFASYAAVAIENTRLLQAAQEQAYVSTVLLQVAEATQSLGTLEEVLDTVVHLMPMLVGVQRCALFLWDEPSDAFLPAAACGLDHDERQIFDQIEIRPGEIAQFDELLVLDDAVLLEIRTGPDSDSLPAPLRSFDSPLLLPLMAHGDVLGAMLVDQQSEEYIREPEAMHQERLAIMRGVAYQAAAAAENARLLEARQEEAYVSAALLQVAQAVVSLNELDAILGAIVRITPMLVGVEWCTILLWSDEEQVFETMQAYGGPPSGHIFALGEFPLLDGVREGNQLIVLHGLEEIQLLVPEQWLAELSEQRMDGVGVLVGAPLSVKGNVLGVMLIGEMDRPVGLDERRREIITGIAQQAALAVQNDLLQQEMAQRERLERELQLARGIQEAFMPEHLPDPPGWGLASTWRAAREVAGDFYDVFELPQDRLGLVIADVADKGIGAALFMALTRTLMRAAAAEGRSPADVLTRVNELLVPDARHGMFVTALYGILSLETGQLEYASAGHHPPLIRRDGTQKLEELPKGQIALGVLDNVRYGAHETVLEPGDSMILYTDGVTEALSPAGTFYGEDRLRDVIQTLDRDASASESLRAVLHSLDAFVGDNPASDDVTLMVVARQEP